MKIKWSDWELQNWPSSSGELFLGLHQVQIFRNFSLLKVLDLPKWLNLRDLRQVIQAKITSFHNFLLSIVWERALRMSADVLIAATRWIKACWMSRLGLKAGVVSLPTLHTLWKAFAMIAGHLSESSRALQSFVPVCRHLKKSARHHYEPATSLATVQYFFMFFFSFAELKRLSL